MMLIESSYNALFFAADSMHCWAPRPFFLSAYFSREKNQIFEGDSTSMLQYFCQFVPLL